MKFLPEPLYIDTETFSPVPINFGIHAYAEPVEIMLFAYAFGDEDVKVVDLTEEKELPDDVLTELYNPERQIVIHNSGFDRTVIRHGLGIDIPVNRIHDTMVQALSHGLPGGLDKLCDIFKVPSAQAKDKDGKKYINKFCKPLPKNQKLRRATRITHPEEWAGFKKYAGGDIEAMRYLRKKMPNWNYTGIEYDLWCLDQKINDRGYQIDVEFAKAAIEAIAKDQERLADRTSVLTGYELKSTSQRDKTILYILKSFGISLPDLQTSTVSRFVDDEKLPAALRELLNIRLQNSTTSTGKYRKLVEAVSSDGRLRGTMQFNGASRTGRIAGRVFQPQNLPRPLHDAETIEEGIQAIKRGWESILYDDVMKLASSAIRGCIVAPEGKKLVIADLANIEGRVAAWLAGEDWKLQAFRDYDAGTGPDLYKLAYAKAFNIQPEEVAKDQRQIGKVMELMLAYAGGVGAFLTGSATYGIDLDKMAEGAYDFLPPDIRTQSEKAWFWAIEQKRTFDLVQKTYIVCDAFKLMWREANPQISSYWKQLEETAIAAMQQPGMEVKCRRLRFLKSGAWLRMILPSGRSVCYPSPKQNNGSITYAGVNQFNRQWGPISTYGGKFLENACQAVSRDVMMYNMFAIEEAGYEVILSVHDELVTETEDNREYNHETLAELMAFNQPWAEGLPLAAAGFETTRYKKE